MCDQMFENPPNDTHIVELVSISLGIVQSLPLLFLPPIVPLKILYTVNSRSIAVLYNMSATQFMQRLIDSQANIELLQK